MRVDDALGSTLGACPAVTALQAPRGPDIAAHLRACRPCEVVVELFDARGGEAPCERIEDLLALADVGVSSPGARAVIDEHVARCSACRALVGTVPSQSDANGDHTELPPVDPSAYALGRELARGGMGRIRAARDLRIGRPVAVKELLGDGRGLAARFEREARVTARLQHPGIVPIYEIGAWPDGTPFYAMRLVEGTTLGAAIARATTLDARLALLPSILAAADAIAFAHAQRVIHRDLTPANIMLGAYGETVVIDWGLAKDLGAEHEPELDAGPYRDVPTSGELTAAGAVLGTAAYMPPEQAAGDAVDERGDVYALGAILYHLLAGHAPFRGTSSEAIVEQVRTRPPRSIAEAARGAPRDLTSIVTKAMARAPAERYPSARELVDELRRFQTGRIVEAHAYTRGELVRRWLRRHRALAVAAIVVTVVAIVAFASVLRARDRAEVAATVAEQQTVELLEEQGRQELLAGEPLKAAAFLNAALQAGRDTPELRLMLGAALAPLEGGTPVNVCASSAIRTFAWAPDGRELAVACDDAIVFVDAAQRKPRARVAASDIDRLLYAPDGKTLVASRNAGFQRRPAGTWEETPFEVVAVDVATARIRVRSTSLGPVAAVAGVRGGRELVIVSLRAITLLDLASGATRELPLVLEEAPRAPGVAPRTALSSDGRKLVIADMRGTIEMWDLDAGYRRHRGTHGSDLLQLGATRDGGRVVTCGLGPDVHLWDTEAGTSRVLRGHHTAVLSCTIDPTGARVLLVGHDGDASIWSTSDGVPLGRFTINTPTHDPGDFTPDGKWLALETPGGAVQVRSALTGTQVDALGTDGSSPRFAPDGRVLAVARGGALRLYTPQLEDLLSFTYPAGHQLQGALLAWGRIATYQGGEKMLWDVRTGDRIPHVRLYQAPGTGIGFDYSRTGLIVASTAEGDVVVLDMDGTVHARWRVDGVKNVGISGDGTRVWAATKDQVQVWDWRSGRVLLTRAGVTWGSPMRGDGRRILMQDAARDDLMQVVDVDSGQVLSEFVAAKPRLCWAFNANDTRTICAERMGEQYAGQLGIWDVATGARLAAMPMGGFGMGKGSHHLAVYGTGRLELWDVHSGQRLHAATVAPPGIDAQHAFNPKPSADGRFVLARDDHAAVAVRSTRDGRVLLRLGERSARVPLPDSYRRNASPPVWVREDLIADLEGRVSTWRIRREQRSAAEIAALVRAHVPWRIEQGRLVAVTSSLAGRVVQAGKPVANITVMARLQPTGNPFVAVTNGAGEFRLEGVPPGAFWIAVDDPESSPSKRSVQAGDHAIALELPRGP